MSAIIDAQLVTNVSVRFTGIVNHIIEESGQDLPQQFKAVAESAIKAMAEVSVESQHELMDTVISAVSDHFPVEAEVVKEQARAKGLPVRPEPEPEVEEEIEVEVQVSDSNDDKLAEILEGLRGIGERIGKLETAAARNGITL